MAIVANFIAFQVGWFACVLGGAHGVPWVGIVAVLLIVILYLRGAASRRDALSMLVGATAMGLVWENILAQTGWVGFTSGVLVPGTTAVWIIALWPLFATTLNISLRWLQGRWIVAALSGAVAGPLAYYAGAQLGAVQFHAFWPAMVALSLGWAVLTPSLSAFAQRYDGSQRRQHDAQRQDVSDPTMASRR